MSYITVKVGEISRTICIDEIRYCKVDERQNAFDTSVIVFKDGDQLKVNRELAKKVEKALIGENK